MNDDLATKLSAYAEGKLDDPEAIIEAEALLTRYIDGRLDEETAQQVDAVLDANAALAKLVNEQREGKQWFEEVCFPAMREAESEPSPKLQKYLADLLADAEAWGKPPEDESSTESERAKVVPFQLARPLSQPSWGLLAASVGGLLVIAGSVFLYQIEGRGRLETTLAQLTETQSAQQNQVTALQAELDTITEVIPLGVPHRHIRGRTVVLRGDDDDRHLQPSAIGFETLDEIPVGADDVVAESGAEVPDLTGAEAVEAAVPRVGRQRRDELAVTRPAELVELRTSRRDVARQLGGDDDGS